MPDITPAAVSRILRYFAPEPFPGEKVARDRDDERLQNDDERKPLQRDEAFFWTWQYPGQW